MYRQFFKEILQLDLQRWILKRKQKQFCAEAVIFLFLEINWHRWMKEKKKQEIFLKKLFHPLTISQLDWVITNNYIFSSPLWTLLFRDGISSCLDNFAVRIKDKSYGSSVGNFSSTLFFAQCGWSDIILAHSTCVQLYPFGAYLLSTVWG